MWMRRFPKDDRDGDEHAAYAVAAWLQRADLNGSLGNYFNPPLTSEERGVAAVEGWILGYCERAADSVASHRMLSCLSLPANQESPLSSTSRLYLSHELLADNLEQCPRRNRCRVVLRVDVRHRAMVFTGHRLDCCLQLEIQDGRRCVLCLAEFRNQEQVANEEVPACQHCVYAERSASLVR